MVFMLVVAGLVVCAYQAVRAQRLLFSALWLAGASALTALLMYLMGAPEVAVIELSVGAGLVTVLFVFAINIAGEEGLGLPSIVPRPLAWLLVVFFISLFGWINLGLPGIELMGVTAAGFADAVWQDRQLDLFLQILLIFSGVLAILGLMADPIPAHAGEGKSPASTLSAANAPAAAAGNGEVRVQQDHPEQEPVLAEPEEKGA